MSVCVTEGGNSPFFSPDGLWLGFASGGFIRKVPIQGGTPQNIAAASNVLKATWAGDGWIVFHQWWGGPRSGGLFKVAAAGGTPSELTQSGERDVHQVPYALPEGRAVLFAVSEPATAPFVELVDLSTGTRRRLLEGNDPHLPRQRSDRIHARPETVHCAVRSDGSRSDGTRRARI